jgi:hypothetical protein
MRCLYLGMEEDCAQVGLMYKNWCFFKCYANIFVLCNYRVFIVLSNLQVFKCYIIAINRHPRYAPIKSGNKRWRYIRG